MKPCSKKWSEIHENYKTTAVLGQGTYGTVHRAERVNPKPGESSIVALKRCRLDLFNESGIPETTLREVAILHDLKHENVLALEAISCNTSRLYLVCKYFDYDLKKFIQANEKKVPLEICKRITLSIFRGLAYCHGHRVIHRDLKPHNILVDSTGTQVQLADFGLARGKVLHGKTLTQEVVTLWYRAPELLLGVYRYDESIDIWSMGCILAELLTGRALFPGDSEIDTLFKIFRLLGTPTAAQWPSESEEMRENFPIFEAKENFLGEGSLVDPLAKDLIKRMLQWVPSERISAKEVLEHPWFGLKKVRSTPRANLERSFEAATSVRTSSARTDRVVKSSSQKSTGRSGGETAPPLRIKRTSEGRITPSSANSSSIASLHTARSRQDV